MNSLDLVHMSFSKVRKEATKISLTPFLFRVCVSSISCLYGYPAFLHWLNDLCHVMYKRYAHDDESAEDQEETGWKYIHGDVFRYPKNKSLFAAALGSGTQLFTL